MKQKFIYLMAFLSVAMSLLADNASNVRVQQKDKDIIITYDLCKKSNVSLLISIGDIDDSFSTLKSVEGDVGNNVRAGKNLKIIWHPLQESDKFIADNVRFKVAALGTYDQYTLPSYRGGKSMETFIMGQIAYSFAPQMSYGLVVGQTYKYGMGWFIDARTNFHFKSSTNGLSCIEGGYVNGILPFYSGRTQTSIMVAHAGFVIDVLEAAKAVEKNRFNTFGFYAGAGYGWRRLLWETIDGQWIEYSPTSHTGFSANVGVIGSVYGLTLKAGVNTISFKYLEFEAGLGWMF